MQLFSSTDFEKQEDKILLNYLKKFPSLEKRHFIHAATILGRRVPEVEKRYKQLLPLTEHTPRKAGIIFIIIIKSTTI